MVVLWENWYNTNKRRRRMLLLVMTVTKTRRDVRWFASQTATVTNEHTWITWKSSFFKKRTRLQSYDVYIGMWYTSVHSLWGPCRAPLFNAMISRAPSLQCTDDRSFNDWFFVVSLARRFYFCPAGLSCVEPQGSQPPIIPNSGMYARETPTAVWSYVGIRWLYSASPL